MGVIVTDVDKLRVISQPTNWAVVSERELIKRLSDANLLAWTVGAGLAAIQIGEPLRFGYYIYKGREFTLMNPKILGGIGKHTATEGCLSIPNVWFEKERYWEIEYVNDGTVRKAKGFLARLIQHEVDHMNGRLIYDD